MKSIFLISVFVVGFIFAPVPNFCYPSATAHNLSVTNGGHGDINYSATIRCITAQTTDCNACALLDVFYIGENTGSIQIAHDAWSPALQCGVTKSTNRSISRSQLNGFIALHVNPNEQLESDYIIAVWRGLNECVETAQLFHSEVELVP